MREIIKGYQSIRNLIYITLLIIIVTHSFSSWARGKDQPQFTMVHLTDIHYTSTPPETSGLSWKHHIRILGYKLHKNDLANISLILRNTIEYINKEIKPDLVVITGDMVDRVDDPESMGQVKEILDQLNSPWFPVMGDRERSSGRDKRENYREVFGEVNYSFNYKGWHIIMLGVYPDDESLDWLKNELDKNADIPTIICMHQMLVASQLMQKLARRFHHGVELLSPQADRIIDILNNHGRVKAVFSGHSHTNFRVKKDGITYISTAALAGIPYQFRVIRVYENRISTSVRTAHPLRKK